MSVTLMVEDETWRPLHLQTKIRRAIRQALSEAEIKGDLSLLLTTDEKLRALNKAFRDKDVPTNVLSFPAAAGGYLGDIAIAFGLAQREARESGKTMAEHVLHLAVHGTLHLAGFDHIDPREADVMEAMETKILARLGIADPYVLRSPSER